MKVHAINKMDRHMKNLIIAMSMTLPVLCGAVAQAADQETAIFAGGCFWCVESDFESVAGVTEAISGFIGGLAKTASYKKISNGGTGHYEAVQIKYDPSVVSYETLVDIFWRSIDATDDGGQFCDRGDSYKSAIFTLNAAQFKRAKASKKELEESGRLPKPVVTKILHASPFYPAGSYHQNYYKQKSIVITRYGPIKKKTAYKKYRKACGRDARVTELWGKDAFIVAGE